MLPSDVTNLSDVRKLLIDAGHQKLADDVVRQLQVLKYERLGSFGNLEVEALADKITDTDSIDEISDYLPKICETFAIDHYTVHCIKPGENERYQSRVLTTYPHAWIDEYVSEEYFESDPVIHRSRENVGSFFWDELDFDSYASRKFREQAISYGIGPSGYTDIIVLKDGAVFGVSASSKLNRDMFRTHMTPQISDFCGLAAFLVSALFDLVVRESIARPKLTKTQEAFLQSVLSTSWNKLTIETSQKDSLHSIGYTICTMLGAKTIEEAAEIVESDGLLKEAAFLRNEIISSTKDGDEKTTVLN